MQNEGLYKGSLLVFLHVFWRDVSHWKVTSNSYLLENVITLTPPEQSTCYKVLPDAWSPLIHVIYAWRWVLESEFWGEEHRMGEFWVMWMAVLQLDLKSHHALWCSLHQTEPLHAFPSVSLWFIKVFSKDHPHCWKILTHVSSQRSISWSSGKCFRRWNALKSEFHHVALTCLRMFCRNVEASCISVTTTVS